MNPEPDEPLGYGDVADDYRIRRSDGWTVQPIEHAEGLEACRKWHYARSASRTSVYRHGLFSPDGITLGAALWMPPTKVAAQSVAGDDWRGVLVLSRFVCSPDVPRNGESFFLSRSMRMIDRTRWPVLLTYADRALGHHGGIYRATNWTDLGDVPGAYGWINAETGEQKSKKCGPRNFTVAEMEAMGFVRRKKDVKRKFVHRRMT